MNAPNNRPFSLALGGGGAKGLVHIPHLITLDEMGIQISALSGTSMGALVGALYASGLSGHEIKEIFMDMLSHEKRHWFTLAKLTRGRRWYELVGLRMSGSSLLALNPVLERLGKILPVKTFEELKIPFQVVTSDFWNRKPHIFNSGELLPALQASVSIAGLFEPVQWGDRILVDGGAVNPVPFDLLPKESFRIAIDVLGTKTPPKGQLVPRLFESMFNTYQIMEETIVNEKLKAAPPEIYLKPSIPNIRVMEFNRYPEIFDLAAPSTQQLKKKLQEQWEL